MVRKMTERHHRPHRLHSQGFQSSLILAGQDRRIRGEKGFCVTVQCITVVQRPVNCVMSLAHCFSVCVCVLHTRSSRFVGSQLVLCRQTHIYIGIWRRAWGNTDRLAHTNRQMNTHEPNTVKRSEKHTKMNTDV